jgi:pimeloyl-ACP methyl ester carboxylesterase
MNAFKLSAACYLVAWLIIAQLVWAEVERKDFSIDSEPGVSLFVREVKSSRGKASGNAIRPILLIHGARVPGLASFDLDVRGGSLAGDLVERGFTVYVMDVRGYGRSSRPAAMGEPPEKNAPLVRSDEAMRDIGAVVDWIRKRTGEKPALFGWATGGFWAGYFATLHSDSISTLVMLNTLYGGSDKHAMLGHGTDIEDPKNAGKLNSSVGAYRWNSAESLFGVWDRSIPESDKSVARDPRVAKAYEEAALASDPESGSHKPPAFRSPNGCLEDSFYVAVGRKLWDASLIRVPTLVIASERDFWSRPEDRTTLEAELVHAPRVKVVVIPGATHFVHLERAERGRELLIREISDFAK